MNSSSRVQASVLAALLCTIAAACAHATDGVPLSGVYFGFNLPVAFIDDSESAISGVQSVHPSMPAVRAPYTGEATTEHGTGIKLSATVGYELASGFRPEAELFYAQAEIEKLTYGDVSSAGVAVPGTVNVPISGKAKQMGGFLNLWYDFRRGSKWRPYVGGDLGWVRIDQSDLKYDENELVQELARRALGPDAPQYPPGFAPRRSDTDTVFAYHVGAGIGYEFTERLVLQAGYRLQNAAELKFTGRNEFGDVTATTGLRVQFLELGLRYRF